MRRSVASDGALASNFVTSEASPFTIAFIKRQRASWVGKDRAATLMPRGISCTSFPTRTDKDHSARLSPPRAPASALLPAPGRSGTADSAAAAAAGVPFRAQSPEGSPEALRSRARRRLLQPQPRPSAVAEAARDAAPALAALRPAATECDRGS